jgi:5-methylcytosine-specific restriction endonuclease McrA
MVITLDKHKKPVGFCTERRARILMGKRRACLYRRFPAIIILKDVDVRDLENLHSYRIKIDPGSKYTGIAIVDNATDYVVFTMQIEHRATTIVKSLERRSNVRRNRRNRETRYRRCKWINHYTKKGSRYQADSPRPEGWLPPSVKSIGDNIIIWVKRLCKWINITECSFEAVRFDTQLMDNPDIDGVEYQHGTLYGYEIREYLLDKYKHTCQYCNDESKDDVLEWEHKLPKSRGGSDSVKNATLACRKCNQDKGNMTPAEWLEVVKKQRSSKLRDARIQGIQRVIDNKIKGSNRYCAWVSATRRYIERYLFDTFGDVECSSGGRTKYNRTRLGLPKDHHYDALCVGTVPENGYHDLTHGYCLYAKATGRGSRCRSKNYSCGIIKTKWGKLPKRRFGFQNGDIIEAIVPKGKYQGRHVGKVITRTRGDFDIQTILSTMARANYKDCRVLQYGNGYEYHYFKGAGAIPLGN